MAAPLCADGETSARRVAMSIQPGKPGAPEERIELTREDGGCRVSASRTTADGAVLEAGHAELEPAVCRTFWRRLGGLGLDDFEAVERPDPTDDFGSMAIVLDWEVGNGVRTRRWDWTRPLVDARPADALAALLARHARREIPNVPLAYFPEPSAE
ncbi:MAG: hypothetical protein ACQGVK_15320 [Myxococcota bacterium]